jgi:hypothetical protein
MVEEKSYDLLEHLLPYIDCAMHAIAWLRPIHFTHGYLPGQSFSSIAELNLQQIATQDDRHAVKGIAVPGRCLPGRQPLPTHQIVSAMVQHLQIAGDFHS